MASLNIILYSLLLALPVAFFVQDYFYNKPDAKPVSESEPEKPKPQPVAAMQPARTDLAPPKEDPFTQEQLKQFDGADPSKPIYVAIKGTVFDVSHKRDTYGPGKSYNIFAGKDASKGLGKSSLKVEDAIADYSDLPENELKVLNDWHSFFIERYNIVGKVVDLPPAVANL